MLKYILYLIFLTLLSNKLIYNIYSFFFFFFFFFFSNFISFHFFKVSYFFGMDLYSYNFVCLSIWICLLIALTNLSSFLIFLNFYMLYLNILMLMLLIVFTVMDFFFFFFFFWSSMIPVFLILFGWGYQPERLSAGFYLILYTLFGSLPFLLIIFYTMNFYGSFSYFLMFKFDNYILVFFLLFSFLVKFPMYGFHSWLPKAHVEAPVGGSMILAGVLLSLGGYGFIRLISFTFKFILKFNFLFFGFILWSCIVLSMICMIQSDLKMLIAYSSICHMSMVILGLFSLNSWGILGSLVLMIGHGFVSSGMFFLVGMVYSRFSSRSFFILSGLNSVFPSLSLFWFIFCIMNMSCPPSINLFSEICLVLICLSWSFYTLYYLFFILFFSACYSMTIFFLTQHGQSSNLFSFGSFCFVQEYMILFLHTFPVFGLILNLIYFFNM
uniref:NADH dehydrogenase subunit 4 n=1 Tax=Augilodes binghami TaxID=2886263 RepID=UPI001E7DB01E|nr:NADH dehydrogenase subunit 4 [Augilodes binghami]UDL72053.1 NADH dehydrogenase subunit 4 [Augilodes binghami]